MAILLGINLAAILDIRLEGSKGVLGALRGNLSLNMTTMPAQISYYIIANIKLSYFIYVKPMCLICHLSPGRPKLKFCTL